MPSYIEPPRYTWTATTVEEALAALRAARKLLEAHLETLAPTSPIGQDKAARSTGTDLTIRLDLGPLIQAINAAAMEEMPWTPDSLDEDLRRIEKPRDTP